MAPTRGVDRAGFVPDLRKSSLSAPMTPPAAGWASGPDRPIPLRPFRSARLACRARRMAPVRPAPSLVAPAEGEVSALAFLASRLDNRIHLALFHGLVQGVEHSFGTQALGYRPAHDSATGHVEDAGQVHEPRQGRHVDPALEITRDMDDDEGKGLQQDELDSRCRSFT